MATSERTGIKASSVAVAVQCANGRGVSAKQGTAGNEFDRWIGKLKELPTLTREEEGRLFRSWKETGNRAFLDRIIACNAKFVLYVVSETSSRTLEKDELISAGMLGLVNAAKSFEDRGNLFCTYAKFHIRNEIWKAARRARSVVWRDHGLFRSKYCFRLKRERAILACSDIDESEIVRIVSEKYDLNTDDVRAFYEEIGHSDVQLDAPASGEIDVGSRVESWDLATRRSSLEEVLEVELKESIRVSLETLHPRDRQILEETTYSDSPVTFADLAKRLGVSRERIRQIHDRALCKLRVKLLALGVLACKAA